MLKLISRVWNSFLHHSILKAAERQYNIALFIASNIFITISNVVICFPHIPTLICCVPVSHEMLISSFTFTAVLVLL